MNLKLHKKWTYDIEVSLSRGLINHLQIVMSEDLHFFTNEHSYFTMKSNKKGTLKDNFDIH